MPILIDSTEVKNVTVDVTELKSFTLDNIELLKQDTILFPGTVVYNNGINSGSYGEFYTTISGVSGNNVNSTVVWIEVDLTEYNSLNIDYEADISQYSGLWIGIPDERSGYERYPVYYVTNTLGNNSAPYKKQGFSESVGTLNIDVSGMSGLYRILLGCYSNLGVRSGKVQINSVIGMK